MVPRERLELPTCGLGNRCSVLLSYRGRAQRLFRVRESVNGREFNCSLTISVHP
jgi:hypothetical protein